MGRPRGIYSKVARVFGVSSQAVRKWKAKGAPFRSTDGLLRWLGDQWFNRTAENFNLHSVILWADLHHACSEPSASRSGPPTRRAKGA